MRRERLRKLAEVVEGLQHAPRDGDDFHYELNKRSPQDFGFNLDGWTHGRHCGTPRCIGGWAAWLFWPEPRTLDCGDVYVAATHVLGLTAKEAAALFLPHVERGDVTPESAARAIRNLADGQPPDSVWDHERNA